MATVLSIVGPLLLNWLIMFVVCFAIVEFAQNYFYDETTPAAGLKVLIGSFLLAALLTWSKSRYETMFTEDIGKTVLLGIAAFGIFTLIFRFHPQHAAPIGIIATLITAGVATMTIDSMTGRNKTAPVEERPVSAPLRRPAGLPPAVKSPAGETSKDKAPTPAKS